MPYNWKGDALAKLMILILVLVLLVNGGILVGFQLMTKYTYKTSRESIEAYTDYNLIDSTVTDQVCSYLLAAPGKENRLVLTEKHFLFNRHRVLLDQEVDRNFSAELKADLGKVFVNLDGKSQIGNVSLRAVSLPFRFSTLSLRIPAGIFLWNLALLTIELLVLFLIHRIRNA